VGGSVGESVGLLVGGSVGALVGLLVGLEETVGLAVAVGEIDGSSDTGWPQ